MIMALFKCVVYIKKLEINFYSSHICTFILYMEWVNYIYIYIFIYSQLLYFSFLFATHFNKSIK